VLNATKGHKERIGRILQMHANHREEIEEVYAGDIAAAVGLKETFTGDTLSDPDHPVILESMTFPEPVIEVKIEPKTKADQDKLAIALQRLAEEDPTFRVHTDQESGETLIAGMGELHLDVLVDRMVREFKVAANVGKPAGLYRETIRRPAAGNGRFVRQTGGAASTATPSSSSSRPRRAPATSSSTRSSAGPSRASTSRRREGIREALQTGIYAGFPVVDVKATLVDGSYHEVDSSEMAFKIAGSMAVKDAFEQGRPDDPRADHEGRGDHARGVHGRRHRRPQQPARPDRGHGDARHGAAMTQVVRAFVPLAEMFGYVTDLRSMTQGRATYSMEFSHYAEVPASIASELAQKSEVATRARAMTTTTEAARQQQRTR
jgi:elongation factor G